MRTQITLLLCFIYSVHSFSQNIWTVALSDKSELIYEESIKFNLKNSKWYISDYLYMMEPKTIDSITLVQMINTALGQKKIKWPKANFKNRYLVEKDGILLSKKIFSELADLSKAEKKQIKKKVRQYNNFPDEYRSWPISITNPVYSEDKTYCMIGFIFGNNGRHTELYKKTEGTWKRVAIIQKSAF